MSVPETAHTECANDSRMTGLLCDSSVPWEWGRGGHTLPTKYLVHSICIVNIRNPEVRVLLSSPPPIQQFQGTGSVDFGRGMGSSCALPVPPGAQTSPAGSLKSRQSETFTARGKLRPIVRARLHTCLRQSFLGLC